MAFLFFSSFLFAIFYKRCDGVNRDWFRLGLFVSVDEFVEWWKTVGGGLLGSPSFVDLDHDADFELGVCDQDHACVAGLLTARGLSGRLNRQKRSFCRVVYIVDPV